MYLVNFPFFDGFCFKNGARAVCRKIGRLTKHKHGAIKTNPARRRQIQGCCLETRRFCRKAAGSELGRNGRATKDKRGAIKTKPAQSSKIPGPCFRIRACHRKPASTQIGCQQGWFLRWRLNASLLAPPGGCQQNLRGTWSRHLCWRLVFLHFSSSFPLPGSVLDPFARSPLELLFCRVPGSIPPCVPSSLLAPFLQGPGLNPPLWPRISAGTWFCFIFPVRFLFGACFSTPLRVALYTHTYIHTYMHAYIHT